MTPGVGWTGKDPPVGAVVAPGLEGRLCCEHVSMLTLAWSLREKYKSHWRAEMRRMKRKCIGAVWILAGPATLNWLVRAFVAEPVCHATWDQGGKTVIVSSSPAVSSAEYTLNFVQSLPLYAEVYKVRIWFSFVHFKRTNECEEKRPKCVFPQ